MKLVKKAAKMDVASKFRSMQANARIIKHYRSKLRTSIIEAIQDKFEAAVPVGTVACGSKTFTWLRGYSDSQVLACSCPVLNVSWLARVFCITRSMPRYQDCARKEKLMASVICFVLCPFLT